MKPFFLYSALVRNNVFRDPVSDQSWLSVVDTRAALTAGVQLFPDCLRLRLALARDMLTRGERALASQALVEVQGMWQSPTRLACQFRTIAEPRGDVGLV